MFSPNAPRPEWSWSTPCRKRRSHLRKIYFSSVLICVKFLHFELKVSLLSRRPNLLFNLKGDLLGGTREETVSLWPALLSLFGGESEFDLGCCCLKTSALDPVIDVQSHPPTHTNSHVMHVERKMNEKKFSELTCSMPIDSPRHRHPSDGSLPFPG